MEIKVNKEIRDYHESVFMGLSMRQTVCSVLAIGAAVGLYFWLNPILGMETASWVCVFGAAPFAVLGFVSYHKMPAEKVFVLWLKSEILEPKRLIFQPNNLYYEAMKDSIAKKEKEAMRKHESRKKSSENGQGTV